MFRDPGIPDGERTAYSAQVGNREIGAGALEIRSTSEEYRQDFRGGVTGGLDYRAAIVFGRDRADGTYAAVSSLFETIDEDRQVALESGLFTDVAALTFGGEIGNYPKDLVPWFGLPLALRGIKLETGHRFSVPVWLANTVYWELTGRVGGTEPVVVPAGAFEAWKVTMRVSFQAISPPIDRLVTAAIRPFRFYLDAADAHRLVRFDFPTGPFPWNPRGLVEATSAS